MSIVDHYVTTGGTDTYANSTSPSTPCSLTTAFANAVAGDRVNIQAGTYTRTATDTVSRNGSTTQPIIFRGYNSAIGDLLAQGRSGGNGALDLTNFPILAYNATFHLAVTGTYMIYESLDIQSAGAGVSDDLLDITGGNNIAFRSRVQNPSTNAASCGIHLGAAGNATIDCDAALTGASGASAAIRLNATNTRAVGCRVKGGPNVGISASTGSAILGCTIHSSTIAGISMLTNTSPPIIYGNTIYGCGVGILGSSSASATGIALFIQNHITDCSGGAIENGYRATATLPGFFANNRTRDNAGGAHLGWGDYDTLTYNEVTTDTGGPETDYVNAGSLDFNLISAAPGKAVGLVPYTDIGALQRQEAGGGGSGGGLPILGGSIVR